MTTDAELRELFARHCECRPVNTARTSHSHDCDTAITNDCRTALHGFTVEDDEPVACDDAARAAARARCALALHPCGFGLDGGACTSCISAASAEPARCPVCGKPGHPSETDDLGRHPECQELTGGTITEAQIRELQADSERRGDDRTARICIAALTTSSVVATERKMARTRVAQILNERAALGRRNT